MKILLFAQSKQGKELLQEFGNTWDILEHRSQVPILSNDAGFNICPPGQPELARWIHQNGDPNFQVVDIIRSSIGERK